MHWKILTKLKVASLPTVKDLCPGYLIMALTC